MIEVVNHHRGLLCVAAACAAAGLARASYYRSKQPPHGPYPARRSPRALTHGERQAVLDVLHEPRFVDLSPGEVHAQLLDEGRYSCSERTMYRVLASAGELRERRDQLRHPAYSAPELLASAPNTLWSWDITKLLGPAKWTYYYLYVILDVFSRYVIGWMVAECESAALASKLIEETCERQHIQPGKLTIHADRGSSMKSKPVAFLLADLGVTKSHSRPHVSDDNPFSEAQFKTLKYRPDFPERFGSIEDARSHCRAFFPWYNDEHRHVGIARLTPADVHHGRGRARLDARAQVLEAAFREHPERFVNGCPSPGALPTEVWINKPATTDMVAANTLDDACTPSASEAPADGAHAGAICDAGNEPLAASLWIDANELRFAPHATATNGAEPRSQKPQPFNPPHEEIVSH